MFLKTCAINLFLITAALAGKQDSADPSEGTKPGLRQLIKNNANMVDTGAAADNSQWFGETLVEGEENHGGEAEPTPSEEQGPQEEKASSIKEHQSVGTLLAGPTGDSESNNMKMYPTMAANETVVAPQLRRITEMEQAGDDLSEEDHRHLAVLGGSGNTATGTDAVVVGGSNNHAAGTKAFVGAGENNNATEEYSVVAGGYRNVASGRDSFVGSGLYNNASGDSSVVAGGSTNVAGGEYAFVGGGEDNSAPGVFSVVAGGNLNVASGILSAVAGGIGNQADGDFAFSAGSQARASHVHSAVVGLISIDDVCESKSANSMHVCAPNGVYITTNATPAEGIELGQAITTNTACCSANANNIQANSNGIQANINNITLNAACCSANAAAIQGLQTRFQGFQTTGGNEGPNGNDITNSRYSSVVGGYNNDISGAPTGGNTRCFIGGGSENSVDFSTRSSVVGGEGNVVHRSTESVVCGGFENTITGCANAAIVGGAGINIDTGSFAFIGGGLTHQIWDSMFAAVTGGVSHNISNSRYASIVGGENNVISSSYHSFVGGGAENDIASDSQYSTIGGGQLNTITGGKHATVPGGYSNEANGDYSFSAGSQAHATHAHSAVVGLASTTQVCESKEANTMHVCAPNGVYITTDDTPEGIELGEAIATNTGNIATNTGNIQALEDRIAALESIIASLTSSPTMAPTKSPTDAPTSSPTKSPTDQPTMAPTDQPTLSPTKAPTDAPTMAPTKAPTDQPTQAPTDQPTKSPTDQPTKSPTDQPTMAPTDQPTMAPTDQPTQAPTDQPTQAPTDQPTQAPTDQPTKSPTDQPTQAPTDQPTQAPTDLPTNAPTDQPTKSPTDAPTSCTETFVWDDDFCGVTAFAADWNWVDVGAYDSGVRRRQDASGTCDSPGNQVAVLPSAGSGFVGGSYPAVTECDACAIQIKGDNNKLRSIEIPMGGCMNSIEVYMEFKIDGFEPGDFFTLEFTDNRDSGWGAGQILTYSGLADGFYKSSLVIDTTSLNSGSFWLRFVMDTGSSTDRLHIGRVIVQGNV